MYVGTTHKFELYSSCVDGSSGVIRDLSTLHQFAVFPDHFTLWGMVICL